MNLQLGHKIASSLYQGFKHRAPIVAPAQAWAMGKRKHAELATTRGSGHTTSITEIYSPHSKFQPPPSKRRRLLPVAAVAPASPTASVPKATAAAKPQGKAQEDGLWLIVGLGNPGSNYDDTRHKYVGLVDGPWLPWSRVR